MRIGKRLAVMAAASLLTIGVGTFTTTDSAFAVNGGICGSGGNGNCLNAWFGGSAVYIYLPNKSNETFALETVGYCGGQDTVQSMARGDATYCPFKDKSLDTMYRGSYIVQITDGGMCVANESSGNSSAYLGTCANTTNGGGGAQGVIQIAAFANPGCNAVGEGLLVSNYWTNTNNNGTLYGLQGGVPSGNPESLDAINIGCWGGTGWDIP